MSWQPAPLQFPDAELLLTGGFRSLLTAAGEADVHVGRKIPNPRETRMVILTRDGGGASNHRDRPRIRCRVWDSTDQAATNLARKVVALAPKLVQNGTVLHAECLSGPYEVADESNEPQRYVLFEFHTRGTQI